VRERGIVGGNDDLGQESRALDVGQRIAQLLLEDVADHAFALGVEDVEWPGCRRVRGLVPEREQANLWAVAVGQDDRVLTRDVSDDRGRAGGVGALAHRLERLTAAQQRVPTQGHHDDHLLHPRPSRRASPGSNGLGQLSGAKRVARAAPMLRAAPVMIATQPARRPMPDILAPTGPVNPWARAAAPLPPE